MQRQLKVVRMMRLLFDGRGEFPPPPPTPSVHRRWKWQLCHEISLRALVRTAVEGWTEPHTWEEFHVSISPTAINLIVYQVGVAESVCFPKQFSRAVKRLQTQCVVAHSENRRTPARGGRILS